VPKLTVNPQVNCVLRYGVTTTGNYTTNVGTLISCMGAIATTTSSSTSVCSSVRLRKITFYIPALASGGAAEAIGLYWAPGGSSSNLPDKIVNNSLASGITSGQKVSLRPPRGSLTAYWWNSSAASTNLFTLVVPMGTVIDVELSGMFSGNSSGITTTDGSSSLTIGDLYYRALDGVHNGKIAPIDLVVA